MKRPSSHSLVFLANAAILLGCGVWLASLRLTDWYELHEREKALRAAIKQHQTVVAGREHWRKAQHVPDELRQLVPADKDMAVHWLLVIEGLASKHGLILARREVASEQAVGDALGLTIELKWEGTEEALVRFLFDLQSAGDGLEVRQLLIRPSPKGLLSGNLSLDCLYRRDTPDGKNRRTGDVKAPAPPASTATGKPPDFARYQVVLDRKTFGNSPLVSAPPPPREPFAAGLRLVAIVKDAAATRFGFVNTTMKPPKVYCLAVGESEDGIEVIKADLDREVVLLRKGAEEAWLCMGRFIPPPPTGTSINPPAPPSPGASYAERMRRRREAIQIRSPEPSLTPIDGEALQKHLEQYQMDLIRAGGANGPPLPIPLTKEMDDQLVQEGVLPPAESGTAKPGPANRVKGND